jgi:hypothetical protein
MAGSAAAVPAGAGAVDLTGLDMWARDVPYDEFARLRREAPVAWHDEASPNSGFWSVHCYQDILIASRDVATFSSARGISFEEPTDEDMAARRTITDTDAFDVARSPAGTSASAAAARTCAWARTWPGSRCASCSPRWPAAWSASSSPARHAGSGPTSPTACASCRCGCAWPDAAPRLTARVTKENNDDEVRARVRAPRGEGPLAPRRGGAIRRVHGPGVLVGLPWFALGLLVLGFASTWVLRARRSAATQLTDLSAKTPA